MVCTLSHSSIGLFHSSIGLPLPLTLFVSFVGLIPQWRIHVALSSCSASHLPDRYLNWLMSCRSHPRISPAFHFFILYKYYTWFFKACQEVFQVTLQILFFFLQSQIFFHAVGKKHIHFILCQKRKYCTLANMASLFLLQ